MNSPGSCDVFQRQHAGRGAAAVLQLTEEILFTDAKFNGLRSKRLRGTCEDQKVQATSPTVAHPEHPSIRHVPILVACLAV